MMHFGDNVLVVLLRAGGMILALVDCNARSDATSSELEIRRSVMWMFFLMFMPDIWECPGDGYVEPCSHVVGGYSAIFIRVRDGTFTNRIPNVGSALDSSIIDRG